MKIARLWLDVETTGLKAHINDLIQIACIPIIDGKKSSKIFNQYCQPIDWNNIDDMALKVNNMTIEKLKTFQTPTSMLNAFISYLESFNVKFEICGYNSEFDRGFIAALFKKLNRESDFARLFSLDIIDTYKKAKALKNELPTVNLKLETLAKHFRIDISAHEALSDIQATIEVDKHLSKMLGEEDEVYEEELHSAPTVDVPEISHLHLHSKYSFVDSTQSIEEWIKWVYDNGAYGFSIVDHISAAALHEMVRVKDLVAKVNKEYKTNIDASKIKAVPGCSLSVKDGEDHFFINAWAINNEGYFNLIKLSSLGWKTKINVSNVEMPALTIEQVVANKTGIIFGVPGTNGPIARFLTKNKIKEAEEYILFLNKSLDIRLELAAVDTTKFFDAAIGFRGYKVPGGNLQKNINQLFYDMHVKYNIACVPVSDAHYIEASDKIVQDCISRNAFKDNRSFYESRHQLSSKEIYAVLNRHIDLSVEKYKEFAANTIYITDLAQSIQIKHQYHLPNIEIPDEIKSKTDDYNMQLYYLTMHKIKQHGRWNNSEEYVKRFQKEIDVIMKNETLNFLPYFLMYEDVCAHARAAGLLQNIARGSAGGSLLSYYLKVIHVDPVAADLPFERFLSHARIRAGSFPDIDLDIADKARPLVIKYLQNKYGVGFAQISTFQKMKTKNAIKDAMYALYGRSRRDLDVEILCKSIPDSPQGVDEYDFLYGYVDQEGEQHLGQMQTNETLKEFFKNKPEIEQLVKRLIGSIRGWGRHASAFVISTINLPDERVPTMIIDDKELGHISVTQFDAGMVEKNGLVKADILGIKTLSVVSECVKLIKDRRQEDLLQEEKGVPFIYRLPDADKGVFSDFYNKKLDSSFQFSTELIKSFAQEFAPLNRKDLAALTALCRPGSLDAPFEDTTATQYYLDVRNGKRDPIFLHEDLRPILKDSNGVFVYQEEIIRFLVEVAGYTWEESDIIRSAIAKKKHDVIMKTFDKIRTSCRARGWSEDAIETICKQVMAFSNYSFNKSHSCAYGELGYITLYLKHHHPLEWWCAVLNNEGDEDKTRKYITALADKIAPPNLYMPSDKYLLQGDKIYAPMSAIKGIGPAVLDELTIKGPFSSLEDFVERVNHSRVNVGAMSAFIKSRAADPMMDQSIPDYMERRKAFMDKYASIRKSKITFKEDLLDRSATQLFLDEREINKCFTKTLLSIEEIRKELSAKWPALRPTGKHAIPFMMGDVPVFANIKLAEAYLKKEFSEEIGMILLYESSMHRSGEKRGREWNLVSAMLSDGASHIEAVQWDAKKAYRFGKDSIVYVSGKLKPGYRTTVSIAIEEISQVEKI